MAVKKQQTSMTRPANTTAYTAGDVIADDTPAILEFEIGGYDAQGFRIENATMHTSQNAPGTALTAELLLFSEAPAVGTDNVACAITDTEFLNFLGSIAFSTDVDCILGSVYTVQPDLLIKPKSDKIYGVLIATNAYTPISAEVITVSLTGRPPI